MAQKSENTSKTKTGKKKWRSPLALDMPETTNGMGNNILTSKKYVAKCKL